MEEAIRQYLDEMVARARKAQTEFETYSQEQVDRAVRAVGKAVYDNAYELSHLAVDETGMGVYEDKIVKCKEIAKSVWWRLKGKKTRGIIRRIPELGIVEVAKPIGVVGCVAPTTNPIVTIMQNLMCALKCGNAMILSPHPRAQKCSERTVNIINKALAREGMPENLLQMIAPPTKELSAGLMTVVDLCICTGGPSLVRAAYSSGKPAIGVGQGNVQVLVDRDVDFDKAAGMIIAGRTFDNGILCTCEQNVICPEDKADEMIRALERNGAYFVRDEEEVDRIRDVAFPGGGPISKDIPGASIPKIVAMAGLKGVPAGTRVLVCPTKGIGREDVLAKEKLFPVLAFFTYHDWEDAIRIAKTNLEMEGIGHSIVIHSHNEGHIEEAAKYIHVSRYMVNQIGATNLGGSLENGLNPTATLGCGTWGNNSISENLTYYHLMNLTRISYPVPDLYIPTDEEVWGK